MVLKILDEIERLHDEILTVDPTRETDAADRVIALAVQLRDLLAGKAVEQCSAVANSPKQRYAKG